MGCSRSVLLGCQCAHLCLKSESVGGASVCVPDMLSGDAWDPGQSSHLGLDVRT